MFQAVHRRRESRLRRSNEGNRELPGRALSFARRVLALLHLLCDLDQVEYHDTMVGVDVEALMKQSFEIRLVGPSCPDIGCGERRDC